MSHFNFGYRTESTQFCQIITFIVIPIKHSFAAFNSILCKPLQILGRVNYLLCAISTNFISYLLTSFLYTKCILLLSLIICLVFSHRVDKVWCFWNIRPVSSVVPVYLNVNKTHSCNKSIQNVKSKSIKYLRVFWCRTDISWYKITISWLECHAKLWLHRL